MVGKTLSIAVLLLVGVVRASRISVDRRHLKEDFKELMPGESMDDEDLESAEVSQFHYFKLHDYDGNNKLDGLELGGALTHFHGDEDRSDGQQQPVELSDEELEDLINQILKDDDLNNDGYIDYYEFSHAQKDTAI